MRGPPMISRNRWERRQAGGASIADAMSACGAEMFIVDKCTMSGRDMRIYRCDHCQEEHVVDYGMALWQAMSDARQSDD